MNILHIIAYFDIESGGPTTSTYSLLKGMNGNGIPVNILTFAPVEGKSIVGHDSFIKVLSRPELERISYSNEFKNYLLNNKDYDLYHLNGMWQFPLHYTAKFARINNLPYIISPHGMLYPEALRYSKWVKRIFMKLWFNKDLRNASCIHVTCEEEMLHIRNLGFDAPIAVIPNPVDLADAQNEILEREFPKAIAFLGRLSLIKRVDLLIKAWHSLGHMTNDYELLIIGDGPIKSDLEILVHSLSIKNIKFIGFLIGQEKEDIYKHIRTLVLPSDSENFGMVVAESLLRKIPVIASKGTPWKDLVDYNCGWWVDNHVNSLSEAIKEAISISEGKWLEMGKNGRRLILDKYSTNIVSKKMEELYRWILEGVEKPDFVHL